MRMRISAGEHRGRRLRSPRGRRTRPTSEFLRQAIFNILAARVRGARFLDLFAGTGAVGLEALSRGASAVTFVERDAGSVETLRANVAALGFSGRTRVIAGDALPMLARLEAAGAPFDIIFVDPPYARDLAARCMERLAHGGVLSENGILVVQTFHKTVLPERVGLLARVRERRYGESALVLYTKEAACR
jgi:16S rRNA (guanine966-N2)-methyltransferase